jgi:4-oxalocrotonate tautomerase
MLAARLLILHPLFKFDSIPIKTYTFVQEYAQGGKNMPLVTIKIVEGRTIAQKRGMAKDVTDAIAKNIGCAPSAVHIDIVDMKRENYAQGGKLLADSQ